MDIKGNLNIEGTLYAVAKSFQIPHPMILGKKLVYGALEGPENSIFIRGELKGKGIIELPDYWEILADKNTITVSISPIGKFQNLFIEKIDKNKVYIKQSTVSKLLSQEIHCYYIVFAERADIPKLVIER